jgi:hypothetical protein
MGVQHLFLDSGAFSLGPLVDKGKLKGDMIYQDGKSVEQSWYDSNEFKAYMDRYANFVKEHQQDIDIFVNVDVLDDPDRTYKNQKYIERKHGIRPVPVIHSFTERHYIERYLHDGHEYIALGGMGGKRMHKRLSYRKWIDGVFTMLCPRSNHYRPIVKTHGFAVTSWHSLTRYPWYSVDSTTYVKMAGYGWLLVPKPRSSGKDFHFDRPYIQIGVCSVPTDNVKKKNAARHKLEAFNHEFISPAAATSSSAGTTKHIGPPNRRNRLIFDQVVRWLDNIGIPLGTEDGSVRGVVNSSEERIKANLFYFDELVKHLPEWPWKFQKGGGLL